MPYATQPGDHALQSSPRQWRGEWCSRDASHIAPSGSHIYLPQVPKCCVGQKHKAHKGPTPTQHGAVACKLASLPHSTPARPPPLQPSHLPRAREPLHRGCGRQHIAHARKREPQLEGCHNQCHAQEEEEQRHGHHGKGCARGCKRGGGGWGRAQQVGCGRPAGVALGLLQGLDRKHRQVEMWVCGSGTQDAHP